MVPARNKSNSKKTVLKTMRISDYINTLLEKDADSKGITVNALISMIILPGENKDGPTKYGECVTSIIFLSHPPSILPIVICELTMLNKR